MFLILRAPVRAESRVMWLGAERSELQIRAQIRAEKRQLQRNNPRSAYPR